jgi:hypothetical protein
MLQAGATNHNGILPSHATGNRGRTGCYRVRVKRMRLRAGLPTLPVRRAFVRIEDIYFGNARNYQPRPAARG